mgnify:CR=1 FL=1|jgi:hypothetical protein
MSDLMVLNMGELALPFDEAQAEELTKDLTAGLAGGFKRAPRLSMGNSGDWELVTPEGEVVDLGREPKIVIVDQRSFNSRIHYEKSYDEQKDSGEFEAPDCYSTDGQAPDTTVEHPLCDSCKECAYNKISKNYVNGNLPCNTYRRLICVLVNEDGTFSDPVVLEPKYKSLTDDTVVKGRYGSYAWYMKVLTSQVHPVTKKPMPIPTQAVVTTCMAMPKMEVATMKFGIASTANGGYWTLNKEQMAEILRLKDSDDVKELLEPFNAAFNNPSSAGRIPVVNVEVPSVEEATKETAKKSAPPSKKAPEKKEAPAKKAPPAKKTRKVVLGMEHPDVVNTSEYDYAELKEWADDATEDEVREFLAENFPQALEPVEVEVEETKEAPAEVPAKKSAPKRKAVEKKAEESENVVSNEVEVKSEDVAKAKVLAEDLDEFDD